MTFNYSAKVEALQEIIDEQQSALIDSSIAMSYANERLRVLQVQRDVLLDAVLEVLPDMRLDNDLYQQLKSRVRTIYDFKKGEYL